MEFYTYHVKKLSPNHSRVVRVKNIKIKVFPDNTVGIEVITSRGVIYLSPIVDENKKVYLPKKWGAKLQKIAPEVVVSPRGFVPTP